MSITTSDNFTFSYNEMIASIVSLHSYKMPVSFNDGKNFIVAYAGDNSSDRLYLQNRGEHGVFFNQSETSYVTSLLAEDAVVTKNFYEFHYKLEVSTKAGLNIEDVNFTRYKAYNEYQDTGYITLANDTIRTRKHLRIFRTQFARDINSRNGLHRLCNENIYLTLEYDNLINNGNYLGFKLYPFYYTYNTGNF